MTERRDLEDGKAWLLARLDRGVHPLDGMDPEAVRATIAELRGLEPEPWTEAWGALSDRYAAAAERAGSVAGRRRSPWRARHRRWGGRPPWPRCRVGRQGRCLI